LKMKGFSASYSSWGAIHALLVSKNLYHFSDERMIRAVAVLTERQSKVLAKNLFLRCKKYMNTQFWFELAAKGNNSKLINVQVETFEYLLCFKKSAMKDLICKHFFAVYLVQRGEVKRTKCRLILASFFYSLKLKRQWRFLVYSLLSRFKPLKFFVRRCIMAFRVRRRVTVRLVIKFLNRRVWKRKVHKYVLAAQAVYAVMRNNQASFIQRCWRGYLSRNKMYDAVILVIRHRILEKKQNLMANRIYRSLFAHTLLSTCN
jgi:hypothetical protein